LIVCQLYKLRWQIELFFKWIKQHLRIKSFFGTSVNAVKTQVWIAISVYVLVVIIKKELKMESVRCTKCSTLSAFRFSRKPAENKHLREISMILMSSKTVTNCPYSTYNGTVLVYKGSSIPPGRAGLLWLPCRACR